MTNIKPREAFRMAIYKLAVRVVMVHGGAQESEGA